MDAVRAILVFGSLMGVGAAVLVLLILGEMLPKRSGFSAWSAVVGAGCFVLNPFFVGLTLGGLEAPLHALLLAALVWWTVRDGAMPFRSPLAYAVLAILFALVYLVRTDNAFFLIATMLLLIWRRRAAPREILWLALSGLLALVLVCPWLVWNLRNFGSIFQGSATALPLVRTIHFFDTHPGAGTAEFAAFRLRLFLGWFPAMIHFSGIGTVWLVMVVLAGCASLAKAGRAAWRATASEWIGLVPLVISVLSLGFVHKYVRLATREWYYVQSDLLLAILWGVLFWIVLQAVAGRRWLRLGTAAALVVLVVASFVVKYHRRWSDVSWGFVREIMSAVENAPDLRPGEPIGATDSGIIGFFASRPVINLDGVVNPQAQRAIRDGRLLQYVRERNLRFVLVTPRMMSKRVWGEEFPEALEPYPPLGVQWYRVRSD